mmetsp:Transcript_51850/g.168520  ORF Transcript_51850/g.168520 Transcript_51850/m.168520 type:complete len:156 (+) Transcript_51850:568-1035(+)
MCNTNCVLPKSGYLELVRDLCSTSGALLIFDEVITGFRLNVGGAQKLMGITPDLAIFAKAMSGGFPISMVAGKRDVMNLLASGKVLHAGTANGNVMSVAAACATLQRLSDPSADIIGQLTANGLKLMSGLRNLSDTYELGLIAQGPGHVFAVSFS